MLAGYLAQPEAVLYLAADHGRLGLAIAGGCWFLWFDKIGQHMTHKFLLRVYYEDTDMAGIVYYANYLRYIERARSEWVRELGLDQNEMRAGGVVFVVRRLEADYIAPARFGDDLLVESLIEKKSGVRLLFHQKVLRADKLLFDAVVTAVCMNAAGKVVRLPPGI